jgi:hypothetical protein
MGHHEEGSEVYTLERMRQYCIRNPHHRVTYLHSKGSYHASTLNDNWRKVLTAAALSKDCIDPPDRQCTVCSAMFFTQFTLFVPGNMFTASCGYVSKLLSPVDDFPNRHTEAIAEVLLLRLRRQITTFSLYDRKDYYGLDRYNAEHWIASHPDVVPCDLSDRANISGFQYNAPSLSELGKWTLYPRHWGIGGDIPDIRRRLFSDSRLRRREYFLLPGFIVKWLRIYGTFPSPESWCVSNHRLGNMLIVDSFVCFFIGCGAGSQRVDSGWRP